MPIDPVRLCPHALLGLDMTALLDHSAPLDDTNPAFSDQPQRTLPSAHSIPRTHHLYAGTDRSLPRLSSALDGPFCQGSVAHSPRRLGQLSPSERARRVAKALVSSSKEDPSERRENR